MSALSYAGRQHLLDKSDAVLLLKRLNEITTAVNQGGGDEYLGHYKRLLTNRQQRAVKNSVDEDVFNQLGIVRISLALFFTNCNVSCRSEITATR